MCVLCAGVGKGAVEGTTQNSWLKFCSDQEKRTRAPFRQCFLKV